MSDPDFPYLVVGPRGERIALYARAEMALSLCEDLGKGATIQSYGTVLWRHDGDGLEMFGDAVTSMREQIARLEKN